MEQEAPARAQRALEALEDHAALLWIEELDEHGHDHVVGLGHPLPVEDVGHASVDGHAALLSESPGFCDTDRRDVHCRHEQALFGEEHRITALAVTDDQRS